MKLTLLGGGGFRVPLLFKTLLADQTEQRVTHLTLWDTDVKRVAVIKKILLHLSTKYPDPPAVNIAMDLESAIKGADFIFSAIRVGGVEARAQDELIAAKYRVIGQETTGFGGMSYALRAIPEAVRIAQTIKTLAPEAYLINFTNPAGIITEVSAKILGDKVIGICDSPVALGRRALRTLEEEKLISLTDSSSISFDYLGLNHLGWLQGIKVDGEEVLNKVLERPELIERFEEGRLFGAQWLKQLGALPNEYLHYYYFSRQTLESDLKIASTRGIFLQQQQEKFYEEASALDPSKAFELWEQTRLEREETYMASNREAAGGMERDEDDLESGGYDEVALAVMKALAFDKETEIIVNTPNAGRIDFLSADAVIEAPCIINSKGITHTQVTALPEHARGLVMSVKHCERKIIEAALQQKLDLAVEALALHPLIPGVQVARELIAESQKTFSHLKNFS